MLRFLTLSLLFLVGIALADEVAAERLQIAVFQVDATPPLGTQTRLADNLRLPDEHRRWNQRAARSVCGFARLRPGQRLPICGDRPGWARQGPGEG